MKSQRSARKLWREQFNRTCELRAVLDRFIQDFGDGPPRLHVNQATDAILVVLQREYRLGRNAQRRKAR